MVVPSSNVKVDGVPGGPALTTIYLASVNAGVASPQIIAAADGTVSLGALMTIDFALATDRVRFTATGDPSLLNLPVLATFPSEQVTFSEIYGGVIARP